MGIIDSAGYSNFECPSCGARSLYHVYYNGLDRTFQVRMKCHGRSYAFALVPEVLKETGLDIREIIDGRLKYTIMEEKRAVDRLYEPQNLTAREQAEYEERVRCERKEPESEDLMARPIRKIELD